MEWGLWVSLVLLALALRERRLRRQAEQQRSDQEQLREAEERLRLEAEARAMAAEEFRARIEHVVDLYAGLAGTDPEAHYHELMRAGIGLLPTHAEIIKACELIVQRGLEHPIPLLSTYPSLDLKLFFATAQERGYDFRRRGNPAALADELLRPRVRAALEAVASRQEAATITILEESDQRLAATVEGMRPLIALLNQLRDEIGEREDIKIEPAKHGHMALLDTRSSAHRISMRFDYEPDRMRFRVERRDQYTFGDWNSYSDVKYASSPDEAFASAIEAVGSHLGSERAHEVRRAPGASK
jgi:hypothetical protein